MERFTFDSYVVHGDCSSIMKNGYEITATIVNDETGNIDDYECYSQEDIDSWKRDEWHFFGVVLSAKFNGIDIPIIVSLWGIEGNMPGREAECSAYMADEAMAMLDEAMAEAQESRKQLILKLMN